MTYTWLPPLLNEIADVAGMDAALAMARARGGSRISIPAKCPPDHWIVQACGPDAAQKICDHFRVGNKGAVVDLPLGPNGSAEATRRRVDQMIRDGVPADQIARDAGVHRTTVFRRKHVVAYVDAKTGTIGKRDDRQPSLFD